MFLKNKLKDNFLKASFISTIGIIITRIISVIYTIPFAYLVSGDAMSINNYSYTIFNQFYELSLAGLPLAIAKLVSKYNSRKEYIVSRQVFKLSMIIMFILGLSLFIGLYIISSPFAVFKFGNSNIELVNDLKNTIRIISPSLLILPVLSGIRGYLQGFKTMIGTTVSQVIERISFVISLLFILYFCIFRLNLSSTISISYSYISLPLASFIALISILPFYKKIKNKHYELIKKQIENKIEDNKKIIKEIIYTALPFVISGLAATLYATITTLFYEKIRIYQNIDKSLIEIEYNSIIFYTNKLISIPLTFSLALSVSVITFVTHYYEQGKIKKVILYIKKSYNMIIYSTLGITFIMIMFGKSILHFFYGNITNIDLVDSIFKVDCFRGVLFAIETIVISLMQSINEKNRAMFYTLIGPVIKIILMFPLVYYFGIYGEILSIIIGLSSVIYLSTNFIKNKFDIKVSLIYSNFFRTMILVFPSILLILFINMFLGDKLMLINENKFFNFLYLSFTGGSSLLLFLFLTIYIKKYKIYKNQKIINN